MTLPRAFASASLVSAVAGEHPSQWAVDRQKGQGTKIDIVNQLDLSDEDLKCLQAGFPLNEKVVNAVLHILVTLAPSIVTAVESFADIAPDTTRRRLQAPNASGPRKFILIPIHNPTSGSSKGRWVLAVISFGVLRILDSSPTRGDTEFADEKIKTLFPSCEFSRHDNDEEY
jgi:hypothetical protein